MYYAGLRHLGRVYVTAKQKAVLLRGKSSTAYRFNDPRIPSTGIRVSQLTIPSHDINMLLVGCSMLLDLFTLH